MSEDNWWSNDAFATAAGAKSAALPKGGPGIRAKPLSVDIKDLQAASDTARVERDAERTYASTAQAVKDMGTGPWKARYLDAITPEQDGGILDTIGGVLGAPLRMLVSDKTLRARDQMNTVGAQTALAGSSQMKGSSSDKDVALMRMGGVGAYKSEAENLRILKEAKLQATLNKRRAMLKAKWIGRYGSTAQPAPDGYTFETATQRLDEMTLHPPKPQPRRAPPSARSRPAARAVYDLNGNLIK